MARLHEFPIGAARLEPARAWLADHVPPAEVLVVAPSGAAAADLLRGGALSAPSGAAFGWHRATLGQLAAGLAESALVTAGLVPIGPSALEAVVTRAVQGLRVSGELGRFDSVADGPGFCRALARTLSELRMAGADPAALKGVAPELLAILEATERELAAAGLADRAEVFKLATAVARDSSSRHLWLGLPTLLLDLPLETAAEAELVGAVVARSPDALATVPSGDVRAVERLRAMLRDDAAGDEKPDAKSGSALTRLQQHLFEDVTPPEGSIDDDSAVEILSAPGESRECVEIARRIRRLAAEGIAFDRIAVLLRSVEEYRPHLEEAFGRAEIPVHFARGAVRPDPAGRAFLALLACAAEGLSARRFAEYLSLAQVPDATSSGGPPPATAPAERWVAPDQELVPQSVAESLGTVAQQPEPAAPEEPAPAQPADTTPVFAGTLRAPRRWEQLLVDAAVIGGRDRWERRLTGLEHELRLDLEALEEDDPDHPRADYLRRQLADLVSLGEYALPLLEELAALPTGAKEDGKDDNKEGANWGTWLDALSSLATRALRQPGRVLSVLAELAPMAQVGPVSLSDVQQVLEGRLLEVAVPAASNRYGQVFVAPCDAARGMSFEIVFVPGLAERLFPRKIAEDPILLDAARRELGCGLTTNEDRVARERLSLRLAVGAARERVVLSYPRLDLDQSRPRVPSFYALEALRAAEGRLPGFDELEQRAEDVSQARVGWPAPTVPEDAIDAAEHDLALLDSLLQLEPEKSVGMARYLLTANPHLGRALRFRARRWLQSWTVADGLVKPSEAARQAMAAQQLSARSYSPTALQNYASCPYRFLLSAVHRLAPREEPEAIEELDPLQKGSLVHEVQFELLGRLRDQDHLPVRPNNLPRAHELLDEVLDAVAERTRDELAPAIERVWEDGVAAVRADLREWLVRASVDESGFVPWRFELAFGLPGRRERDPGSVVEPVLLDNGIQLRGSIDLVERSASGAVRVTDHKTGKDRMRSGAVIGGGEALQPVLYGLVAEKVFPDAEVGSGRLYYCTSAGGFNEVEVPLDRISRESAQAVADTIGKALEEPFLPAAPAKGACMWCDYKDVCGPYEELRTSRKAPAGLAHLDRLRGMP